MNLKIHKSKRKLRQVPGILLAHVSYCHNCLIIQTHLNKNTGHPWSLS